MQYDPSSYITKQACLANQWQPAESCLVTPAQQQTKLYSQGNPWETEGTVRESSTNWRGA